MISVAEAKNIILSFCKVNESIVLPIEEAVGYCLSETVISAYPIPSFHQSSMDGYAIRADDKKGELFLQDSLPAGSPKQITLLPGAAIQVFTGGPVPTGADMVVPIEQITKVDDRIIIQNQQIEIGMNIRLPGAEIKAGEVAIPKGTVLIPMHIGYLASVGVSKISVIKKPAVAIIITGNELVQPGSSLQPGQVYESNSYSLKACLQEAHIQNISIFYTRDTLAETEKSIVDALEWNDMVLITGGVSVGDHDHVASAAINQGVEKHFHGVKQRPGKPFFFGTKNNKPVFGLPGNPSSVLSCYQQYVLPAIHTLSGTSMPAAVTAKLISPYEKKLLFTFFLKGYVENGQVEILSAQASFQLSAFVKANCWIELEETATHFEKGAEVRIHLFA